MSLVFLSSLRSGTGNATTIRRIMSHFKQLPGVSLHEFDVDAIKDAAEFHGILQQLSCQSGLPAKLVFGVHAFRAGRLLVDPEGQQQQLEKTPYVIILGGTDVNENQRDPAMATVMAQAVRGARMVVAFTETMKDLALSHWKPELRPEKIVTIAQAVETAPSKDFSLRHHCGLAEEDKVLVLPCGIRPVKDPLYLLYAFGVWRKTNPQVHLVFAGPKLNDSLATEFLRRVSEAEGVHYLGELPLEDLHACLAQANVVLNSSLSEGLSNALLEAMQLGKVVLVRHIPGNTALVSHGVNGFLFASPQEFVDLAQEILFGHRFNLDAIRDHARQTVDQKHGLAKEREGYLTLLAKSTTTS